MKKYNKIVISFLSVLLLASCSAEFLDYEPRFSLEDGIKAYIPEIKRLFAEEVK